MNNGAVSTGTVIGQNRLQRGVAGGAPKLHMGKKQGGAKFLPGGKSKAQVIAIAISEKAKGKLGAGQQTPLKAAKGSGLSTTLGRFRSMQAKGGGY